MEGWISDKLENLFETGSGTTPQSTNSNYYDGNINWLLTGDLNDGIITSTSKKITSKALSDYSTLKLYPKNSVVIALYGATIGKLGFLDIESTTNQACCVLFNSKRMEQKYLFYNLLFAKNRILALAVGGGQPNISQNIVKNFEIAFPELLPEQQKIATILSTIDQTIDQTEQLIAKYKNIKQGLMHDLLTYGIDENGTIRNPQTHTFVEKKGLVVPEEWEVDKFDNLFRFYPTASYSRAELGVEGDFYCVHYGDIHTKYDSFLYADKENLPTITEKQSNRYMKLIDGDLVMADASEDYAGVGKSIEVLNIKDKQIIAGLHTLLIRSKNRKFVNGYRGYIFHNHAVKKLLDDVVTGWKVYSISKGRLPEIYIPIPTKREQLIIIKTLNAHKNLIESEQTNLAKLQNMKQGLMADLLTGKVRVKI